jgi:hypothetical protein
MTSDTDIELTGAMKKFKKVLIATLALLAIGFVIPERKTIPVVGASKNDWNPKSFWFEPWGTSAFSFVGSGELIGTLGDSGNAKGKQPHVHYSIVRLIPAPWAIDSSSQGFKKAIFIDPGLYLGGL